MDGQLVGLAAAAATTLVGFLTFLGVRGQTRVNREKTLFDASDQQYERLEREVDRLTTVVAEQRIELGERDLIIGEQGTTIAALRAELAARTLPTPRKRTR